MSLIRCLVLSAFFALLVLENYGYGYWMISRPVVAGAIVGLLMGDLRTGLLVGGSVELMFMGVLPIGGSVPPNAQIAGVIGTAFAIIAGGKPEVGIALAMPVGVLAQFLIMLAWNVNIYLTHRADRYIKEGNTKKIEMTHLSGLAVFFIIFFIAIFCALRFGSPAVAKLVASLPAWLSGGLKIASGILPALGMAMLIKMMNGKKYWAFLLFGFVLAESLHLDMLSIALMGLAIAAGIFVLSGRRKEENVAAAEQPTAAIARKPMLDNKDLRSIFGRSFFSMTSINYERFMSLGFCYAMIPALKKFYPDEDEYKEALARNNEFFNCHPYAGNAVIGVTLALEEEKATSKDITPEVISSTKAALMGPLSGIGDSLFKATFMTIFAALGAGLALQGNAFGPILFLVPNVLLNVFSRWYFIKDGYKQGLKLVSMFHESSLIDRFVQGATIVGLMVTGALIVSFVSVPIALTFTSAGKQIVVQGLLDKIFPGLLAALITFIFYRILTKNSRGGIYVCLILSFAIGILGKLLKVF
jgi:mannose/fructose/N-acetylgalactosamine-specific phosphotransferase system component IID/mannose/fructose/N-acetylgalactosamine-specific phosphotransferase system component IIC